MPSTLDDLQSVPGSRTAARHFIEKGVVRTGTRVPVEILTGGRSDREFDNIQLMKGSARSVAHDICS